MDLIRSRIGLPKKSGEKIVQAADERYRGGPDKPMIDADMEEKVAACVAGLFDDERRAALIEAAWNADRLDNAAELARVIQT